MLDLNVDAVSVDTFVESNSGDSYASSSTVVNADEEPPAVIAADEESNSSTTLRFSILKNYKFENSIIKLVDDIDREELTTTRQLFPVRKNDSLMFRPQNPQHWLNLSVPEIGNFRNKAPKPAVTQPQPQPPPVKKKSRRGPRSRSSQYRGVTFYRRTGRWESHIWDCGKQVYLGGFDTAHAAARAYDRAAIQFRGIDADINFQISDYEEDMKQMKNLTKEEFVQILRRQSTGFSRGSSKYRGVTLPKCGRWEARMGQILGKKAYDEAAIKFNGRNAVTNFANSSGGDQISRANKNEGNGDNLDLNLWISPTSAGRHETDSPRNSDLPFATSELSDGKRLKVESSLASSHGLAMASKNSVIWTGMFSGFAPNNEERARNMMKEAEAIPLPAFSNWPLKFHQNGVITSVPLCSSAASSGFSSSSTNAAYSAAFLTPNSPNKVANAFDIRYPPVTLNYKLA